MSKRTNRIVAVTIAQYATMYVEAKSPEEAVKIATEHKDEYITDEDFDDGSIYVHSVENYTTLSEYYMKKIWTPDGIMQYDEYRKELRRK
jgi:hypothetical protein